MMKLSLFRRQQENRAEPSPMGEFDELTKEQRDGVFRRVVLSRWRHAATPSLREMEDLREVLPDVLTSEHLDGMDRDRHDEIVEALRCGNLAASLRRSGLGLGSGRDDVTMSMVWLACGEGDGLARLWMMNAMGGIVADAEPHEAVAALSVVREHIALLGMDGQSYSAGTMRGLISDIAIGPVPQAAKNQIQDHDGLVRAHLDGLAALGMGPGWQEAHERSLRRLGLRTLPVRTPARQVPEPDEDFTFAEQDEFPVPPTPLPETPPGAETVRVTGSAFSCKERHLTPFAVLERPLPLLPSPSSEVLLETLGDEFPWLADVVGHVAQSQALRARGSRPWFAFKPMLIVGPQGAGKTRFARRLSESSGIPISRVNAAGRSGAIEILGHSPTYKEAHPSAPVTAISDHGVANPLLLIDELSRFGSSDFNGDPLNALIPMLEPETARAFHDDFLRTDVDISHINFVFTANTLSGLPTQLLDRLEVFQVKAPGPEHFDALIDGLVREVCWEHGLTMHEAPPIHPSVVNEMRKSFRKGTSVRRLRSAVGAVMKVSAGHAQH